MGRGISSRGHHLSSGRRSSVGQGGWTTEQRLVSDGSTVSSQSFPEWADAKNKFQQPIPLIAGPRRLIASTGKEPLQMTSGGGTSRKGRRQKEAFLSNMFCPLDLPRRICLLIEDRVCAPDGELLSCCFAILFLSLSFLSKEAQPLCF